MKIEDMSLEELVNKLRSVSYVSGTNDTDDYDDEIFNIKKQIISRFSTLTEKVKELEEYKIHNYDPAESIKLTSEIIKLTAENADLKRQVEDLKSSNHDWYCACDHWNGSNLTTCAVCGRTPYESYPTT